MSLEGAWDWLFGGWQAARWRGGSIIESMVTNDRAFAQLPGLAVEDWTEDLR